MPELTPEQRKALDEFKAIRNVLRVPFPQDLQDLKPPEFPQDRRWKGSFITVAATAPAEKERPEKKT